MFFQKTLITKKIEAKFIIIFFYQNLEHHKHKIPQIFKIPSQILGHIYKFSHQIIVFKLELKNEKKHKH